VARSDGECRRLLSCLTEARYRLCFSLMYACGLRIGESLALPILAIDSNQMLLRIMGKGAKERAVPLPGSLLGPMREFWKTHRHPQWLFPSRTGCRPLAKKGAGEAFILARLRARLDERFTPHVLRHSYATRLLEKGTPLPVVQVLLGHGSIRSTLRYTHLTDPLRRDVKATVDRLFAGLS
jgi:integrase/recombinase XerD